MKPIMLAFAIILVLFGLVGTAQAGPFGYNAGDEMPPIVGTNPLGLGVAEVPAPAGFDGLAVYGTEKMGICGVSVMRLIEQGVNNPDTVDVAVQQLENVLSREYGSYAMFEESDGMVWAVTDDDSDVVAIHLSTRTWTSLNAGVAADHVIIEIHYELTNKEECVAEVNAGLTAGGNVRAEEDPEEESLLPLPGPYTSKDIGDNCENWTDHDTDAGALCRDDSTSITTDIFMDCNPPDTTMLVIQFDKYMSEDGLSLLTALDGVETPQWRWNMHDWGLPNNEHADQGFVILDIKPEIPTIKSLLDHSRLQIRVTEKDGYTHNAAIDISRFDEVIAPVRELCGW